MFLDRLMNQGLSQAAQQVLKFTAARQTLLAEDVANISTPDYVQKDLSPTEFQDALREKLDAAEDGPRGVELSDPNLETENPATGILFHDRNNRSVEQLMSDSAKNALTHNLMIELLKRQFTTMETALKDKP